MGQFGQDLRAPRRDENCVLKLGRPETHKTEMSELKRRWGRDPQLARVVGRTCPSNAI